MAATPTALETHAAFTNTELAILRSRRPNHREPGTADAVESDDEPRRCLVGKAADHRVGSTRRVRPHSWPRDPGRS